MKNVRLERRSVSKCWRIREDKNTKSTRELCMRDNWMRWWGEKTNGTSEDSTV
jgi:hypothetical protein